MLRRVVVILLLVIVASAGGVAAWYTLLPRQRAALPIHVQLTPERITRGRYLVVNVLQCVDCHSERDWTLYGGPPREPIGAGRACLTRNTEAAGVNVGQEHFHRTLCIRNITPDDDSGSGRPGGLWRPSGNHRPLQVLPYAAADEFHGGLSR